MNFAVSADSCFKIKGSEKINKYMNIARDLKKKAVEHEIDGDTNCSRCTWNGLQRQKKNQRKNQEHLDLNIVKID